MSTSASCGPQTADKTRTLRPPEARSAKTASDLSREPLHSALPEPDEPGQGLASSGQLSSSCRRLSLTLVEVMSIMTSWKAAVSSACRCVCSAIFSLNFRGLDAPEPAPEAGPGPGPQPPEPVADIFTERTGRADVVERFQSARRGEEGPLRPVSGHQKQARSSGERPGAAGFRADSYTCWDDVVSARFLVPAITRFIFTANQEKYSWFFCIKSAK